ncbi:hypothetical protein PR002_g19898 [Phytophthora rubi]|uniref:Uncharacterized protein n=1 Tax=Phytophthora rubi TaxID=129364 RepID=A0A6A3JLT9_9STRA|nr:hypothetical protein PR002_g19898 [Phytophthora rubi]
MIPDSSRQSPACTHTPVQPPPPLLVGLCKMLGYCDGPVSVDEVPLAPVRQVLPLPLLAVLFAQLGHYHDPHHFQFSGLSFKTQDRRETCRDWERTTRRVRGY